jgi:hypothetical protein
MHNVRTIMGGCLQASNIYYIAFHYFHICPFGYAGWQQGQGTWFNIAQQKAQRPASGQQLWQHRGAQ